MTFVSPRFPLFLAAALLCYFISPRKTRRYVLLLSSLAFYFLVGGMPALCGVLFATLTVHFSGIWAGALRNGKAPASRRRLPLAVCLTLNFGALAFLKFGGLIVPSAGSLLIPGASFYTFQAAGYLLDVHRGKAEAEKNVFSTALFLSFFPQLIQGPISRRGEIAADLFAGHGWDWDRARGGAQKILWGYFMKLVIADYAAPVVNAVFSDYLSYGGCVIMFAVLLYSVQIYADFAGGINIALGIAEIVGVSLPENFRQPFFAVSLTDFWRRWHITLGTWLKDYLFYPLALSKPLGSLGKRARKTLGNAAGKLVPACISTFCVYIIVGVWHGAGLHLLVFGLLNGVFISCGLFAEPLVEKLRKRTGMYGNRPGLGRAFATLRTFAVMCFLRYFARAGSLGDALGMLRQTFFHPRLRELWNGALLGLGQSPAGYAVLICGFAALLARDAVAEGGGDCGKLLDASPPPAQFAVLLAAVLAIVFLGVYSGNALSAGFIYAGL